MGETPIRLVASDIDGTLLQGGATAIDPQLWGLVGQLEARGVLFCAASGRPYAALKSLFEPVAGRIAFVCENGAMVYRGGELVSETPMEQAAALRLVGEILADESCEVMVSAGGCVYLIPKIAERAARILPFVGSRVQTLQSPDQLPQGILKVSAYREEGAAALLPTLAPRWQGQFSVALAGSRWLDFTKATKGTGLAVLAGQLGIRPGQVMAFGDNYNDAPMLDWAGWPYIMQRAAPELRARYPVAQRPEAVIRSLLEGTLRA